MKRFLTLLALVGWFAGPLEAPAISGTLEQISKSGKIRIGYRKDQPPMSFTDLDGKPVGYSIDLCNRIVVGIKEKIGKEVGIEWVAVSAENRFEAVTKNQIDILCGSTTKTLSRAEKVDFTQLTFVTGASLLTLKSQGVRELADLNGKNIGVVKNTTTGAVLKKMLRETMTDAKVVDMNTTKEGMEALQTGKIAAFSSDQVVLIGLILTAADPDKFSIASDVFSYEPFALAVRRNDADFRLVADRTLSHLYRSGLILQIYHKWFGRYSERRPPVFDALYQMNATPE
ncbi:MAG: transporter substrate-binding domain-containing protein [Deltaproteobacteria bacterium]|nr:transporter substrate-binding domain-containing protein [Deltaproteobacteria bacterium]